MALNANDETKAYQAVIGKWVGICFSEFIKLQNL